MQPTSHAEPRQINAGQTHGQTSLDQIIESNRNVVDSIARRVRYSLPEFACVELIDLIQAGNVGLVNAVRSYSSSTGVPFSVYARFRIRGEMIDMLRRLDAASRTLRVWQRKIRRATQHLSMNLDREPTEEEIGGQLGLRLDRLRRKNLDIRAACAVARPEQGSDTLEEGGQEHSGPREARPDSLRSERERTTLITFAIKQLPDRPKRIILMYYQQELTMRKIGEILNLDESRISQIHKRALGVLADHLRTAGIKSSADL